MSYVFDPTPTMGEFMRTQSYVSLLAGPVGGGKSVCCTHKLVYAATLQNPDSRGLRRTRWLVTRNTSDQLRTTTMKTFFEWVPPSVAGTYRVSDRTFVLRAGLPDGTMVEAEFLFIPLDTPDDIRKALSLELTGLWGNEARELHPEVIDGLLGRINRFPSMRDGGPTVPMAIFDTNMPDIDTWWFNQMEFPPNNWDVFIQPPAILSAEEYIAQERLDPPFLDAYQDRDGNSWYINPRADNLRNLKPDYYPNLIPGKTIDWINVYLRCKYGRSLAGFPVYDKSFREEIHVAKERYEPLRSASYPLIVGIDFGRTPAVAFTQPNHKAKFIVLSELTSQGMGLETFITTKLRPHILERYQGCSILMAPDPAGFDKQQISEVTPVDMLRRNGWEVAPRVSNNPAIRIQAVERMLLQADTFQINPECQMLIKGFKYGYRYKTNRNGITDEKPDKNEYSHPHDALQYASQLAEQRLFGGSLIARRGAGTVARRAVSPIGWT